MDYILHASVVHREKNDCTVLASYPFEDNPYYRDVVVNTILDLTGVEDDQICIPSERFTVHMLTGELYYVCLTPNECSLDTKFDAQEFLEQVRSVYRDLAILTDFTHESLKVTKINFSEPLLKIITTKNYQEVPSLPIVKDELAQVRKVLIESVQKLIDRGQRLEELVKKTQKLEITMRKDFQLAQYSSKKKQNIWFAALLSIVMLLTSLAFGIFIYIEFM
ncbi:uncharacterized protein LOC103572444 [Microplitis demolitor]|uniref:uncharacterized protein LOC103572444 n=1 Tax=Microplitis demolitor TaxID=69319 RepID=UPI0004CD2AFA|nr:uncharacterized protein LOC103572444 [Microplitis demolitor]